MYMYMLLKFKNQKLAGGQFNIVNLTIPSRIT